MNLQVQEIKKKLQNKRKKGFTLVELIVVIAILALLAVGAVFAFNGIQRNAQRATFSADATALARALNNYNSLAATPILDNTAIRAQFTNGTLHLEVAADGPTGRMDFGFDIDQARLNALIGSGVAGHNITTYLSPPTPGAGGAPHTGVWTVNQSAIQAKVADWLIP